MSYRSQLAIQFKDKTTLNKVTDAVDEAVNEYCDLDESYIMYNPDEEIDRPDGSIIYVWDWLNECDEEFNTFFDTIQSNDFDIAIVRVGERSDDAEETWYGDIDFNCDIYLDRDIYHPIDWAHFKFNKLPRNEQEAKWFAIDWQQWQSTQSLTYEKMNEFSQYFKLIGDFYYLTDEFKENGII